MAISIVLSMPSSSFSEWKASEIPWLTKISLILPIDITLILFSIRASKIVFLGGLTA